MRLLRGFCCLLILTLLYTVPLLGQDLPAPAVASVTVPHMIRVSGSLHDPPGQPLNGPVTITFSLYENQDSADPSWQEAQNLSLGPDGHYHAILGAGSANGLPLEIFSSGEARWLGVRATGQPEEPRVLLLSVAYALKAADADTLGGLPAAAFVLAGSFQAQTPRPQASAIALSPRVNSNAQVPPPSACTSVTSDGTATANQIAKFTTACNIENSAIFENGGKVGIGNTSPGAVLDVSGTAFTRGQLSAMGGAIMTPIAQATTTTGYNSNPLDISASSYNTTLIGPANYIFRWQSEPTGNNSTNTGATLNLLFGVSGSIAETGVKFAKNGIMTFAPGQTFPGTATVTSVGSGAGLTGGPITTSGTLSIPTAGVTNAMLANSSVIVKVGTGLSGGGAVALGGTTTLSLMTNCATGQILVWNSTSWVCGSSGGGVAGTTDGIAYFSSPASLTSTAAPSNGQLLIGSTGAVPALATLTAGSNITITNGPGSVQISASGSATTLSFFETGNGQLSSPSPAGTNSVSLWGFQLPYNVTTTTLTYNVTVVDNTANLYDLGVFNNSGKLVLDIGATAGNKFAPTIGFHTLSWHQGSTSLTPGRYYIGFTTNCSSACASIGGDPGLVSFLVSGSGGATTGGTLSSTITPPTDVWKGGTQPTIVIH